MLPKLVVIEGPKGGGKSTLAQYFVEKGYAYHHEGPPPNDKRCYEHYASTLFAVKQPAVLDRHYLGEFIYGPLFRGKSRLSFTDMMIFKHILDNLHAALIICCPTWSQCELRVTQRNDPKDLVEDWPTRQQAHTAWQVLLQSQYWKAARPALTLHWYDPPMRFEDLETFNWDSLRKEGR